jgi:hypothetical protein
LYEWCLAGLLARLHLNTFPFKYSGMKILMLSNDDLYLARKAYSYGDSAGFTPDFPFNGACANQIRGKSNGLIENGELKIDNVFSKLRNLHFQFSLVNFQLSSSSFPTFKVILNL